MQKPAQNKLNSAQLNLIKSFQFLRDEQQISEIDSLINFYLEKKLDDAISKVEFQNNYTEEIYEEWLNSKNK
jgi:hypothetical protein